MSKLPMGRNAVIAAMAGAALLVGGSTYALWSASAGFSGGTITAGNMNITAGEMTSWDVSADRIDLASDGATIATADDVVLVGAPNGLPIDLTSWTIVPGDTVALVFPYEVTLKGENLVASLTLPGLDSLLTSNEFANLTLKYQVFDGAGVAKVESPAELPSDDFEGAYFRAADGDAGVALVLYVTFDSQTADRDDVEAVMTLANDLTVQLEQVRCDGADAGKFAACALDEG